MFPKVSILPRWKLPGCLKLGLTENHFRQLSPSQRCQGQCGVNSSCKHVRRKFISKRKLFVSKELLGQMGLNGERNIGQTIKPSNTQTLKPSKQSES